MKYLLPFLTLTILLGCSAQTAVPTPTTNQVAIETPVTQINLSGPVSAAEAEVSGMAWYGDWLILLPQYPNRVGNSLYALSKADIMAYLDSGSEEPLLPQPISLKAPGMVSLAGYQGLEAIVFDGETLYVTIEAKVRGDMQSYLLAGEIAPDLSEVQIGVANQAELPAPVDLENYSDETMILLDGSLLTIYEANGQNVNPNPIARILSSTLEQQGEIEFPNIEYRITDATVLDENGRFYAINYLFGGSLDKLNPASDPLVEQFGLGPTHAAQPETVERLVEFQYTPDGITLTETPPIPLQLRDEGDSRNWEGIVRLDDRGFLLVTDKFPTTILAFVPSQP